MFNWVSKFDQITTSSILASIILALILVVVIFLFIFRPKPKKELLKYFYAFTSGFLLVIAILGLFSETKESVLKEFGNQIYGINILYVVLMVLGALVLSLLILLLVKRSGTYKSEKSPAHSKWIGIFLILAHRIPSALTIGLLSTNINNEAPLFIAIALHIIPEIMLLYYRQIEMNYSKKKIFINIILINIIFFPMILLGTALEKIVSSLWWLESMIFFGTGIIMAYGSISELIPEYINYMGTHVHAGDKHEKHQHSTIDHIHELKHTSVATRKRIVKLSLALILGISIAALILIFHNI